MWKHTISFTFKLLQSNNPISIQILNKFRNWRGGGAREIRGGGIPPPAPTSGYGPGVLHHLWQRDSQLHRRANRPLPIGAERECFSRSRHWQWALLVYYFFNYCTIVKMILSEQSLRVLLILITILLRIYNKWWVTYCIAVSISVIQSTKLVLSIICVNDFTETFTTCAPNPESAVLNALPPTSWMSYSRRIGSVSFVFLQCLNSTRAPLNYTLTCAPNGKWQVAEYGTLFVLNIRIYIYSASKLVIV